MGPGAPNIGVGAQGRSVWSVWLSSGGVASVAGLITQRSSVQIRPPQPLTTRGERTQEPQTPSLYPDFTQELELVRCGGPMACPIATTRIARKSSWELHA